MQPSSPVIVFAQLTDQQTFWIAFCIVMAALLALLVLGTDKDGRFRAK